MPKNNDIFLKFSIPNLSSKDLKKLICKIVNLYKYNSSMKKKCSFQKLLKKYSNLYPILCNQSIKYQNNFKCFDETYHL